MTTYINGATREAVMQAAAATDIPIPRLEMALAVFSNLLFDLPLSPAQVVDFGVDSPDHYRALSRAIDAESEAEMAWPVIVVGLARRLGSGAALSEWTREHWLEAPTFITAYDGLNTDPDAPTLDDERSPHP